MSDIRPFLSTIPAINPPGGATPRSYGSALAAIESPEPVTSWLPQGSNTPAHDAMHTTAAAPEIDTSAIEDEARARGEAEGLAQTAELRAQLQAAIDAFTQARTSIVAPTAEKVAAAAAAVISAWTETAAPQELYAPIIAAWIANAPGPSTVCVAPAGVAAMKELASSSETPLTVTADPSMKRGDVRLSSATRELAHSWDAKMPDLRDAIAMALESQPENQ